MPDVGDDPVARCKRSAPAKHPVRDADEAICVSGGAVACGGVIRAAGAALRGCLFRSLLSLSRYAALRGIALCGFIIAS